MTLQEKINGDLKNAIKTGQREELGILRLIVSAFHNRSIEKRGAGLAPELADNEAFDILVREVKKRRDAAVLYRRGGRLDRADQEEREAVFIQRYLPAPLSREEIEKKVNEIFSRLRENQGAAGAGGVNFGPAMKAIMAELKGKADAGLVSEILKERL